MSFGAAGERTGRHQGNAGGDLRAGAGPDRRRRHAQIPAIVDGLRKRYPAAGSAELSNYLITAYCPGVDKAAGLSDAQKTARVKAFSKAVLSVLY